MSASLLGLPCVLTQLLFQCLDSTGKLLLARCNQAMLQQARSTVVWQCCPLVPVRFAQIPLIASSLLRFAPISVRLEDELPAEDLYDQFARVPLLRGLDGSELQEEDDQSAERWERMLALPCMQRLTSVNLPECTDDPDRMLAAVSRLPSLSTFLFQMDPPCGADGPVFAVSGLIDAPSLTDLIIEGMWLREEEAAITIHAIAQYRQLRRLCLSFGSLTGPLLQTLLTSLNLRGLQHLWICVSGDTAADWHAIFANLPELRSLQLEGDAEWMEGCVDSLARCTFLRSLRLHPRRVARHFPTPPVLARLRAALPQLHCE